jgi:hypothetical protein
MVWEYVKLLPSAVSIHEVQDDKKYKHITLNM